MARYVYGASRSYQARMYRTVRRRQGGCGCRYRSTMRGRDYLLYAGWFFVAVTPVTLGLSLFPAALFFFAFAITGLKPSLTLHERLDQLEAEVEADRHV